MRTHRLGGAQQRAQVLRILDHIEEQNQRRFATSLRQIEHVVDRDVGILADLGQNALMAVGDPIEHGPLYVLNRDRALLRQSNSIVEVAAFLHAFGHQQLIHFPPVGAKHFINRVASPDVLFHSKDTCACAQAHVSLSLSSSGKWYRRARLPAPRRAPQVDRESGRCA